MRLFLKTSCLRRVTDVRFYKIAYIVDVRGEFCVVFLQLSARVLGQSFSSLLLFFSRLWSYLPVRYYTFSRIAL